MIVIGIILAAGTSSRMGATNKLLLKYKSHTIIEEVLEQMLNSEVDRILVVTGFESDRIEEALIEYTADRVSFVLNRNYRLGRAESVRCAIRQIDGRVDAALFMVADKPGVTSDLINRAIDRFMLDRPAVLYVETPAGRGHPIIFSQEVFSGLLKLQGDHAGDRLIAKYRDDTVKLEDDAEQIDVDSEADYNRLLKQDAGEKVL
jgi:molybdenum cofactor cytidylyltransferase